MIEKITDEQLRKGQNEQLLQGQNEKLVESQLTQGESKGFDEMHELELLRHIAKTSNRTSLNVAFIAWTSIVSIVLTALWYVKYAA